MDTTRRGFLTALPVASAALALTDTFLMECSPAHAGQPPLAGHFHPKGKAPSKHTLDVLRQARSGLPFADVRDFEREVDLLSDPAPDD